MYFNNMELDHFKFKMIFDFLFFYIEKIAAFLLKKRGRLEQLYYIYRFPLATLAI